MKKLFSFLRSMTFGMILLVAAMAFSFAGSFIPQQRAAMEYVERFGADAAKLIMLLGLDRVFSSWYFILIVVLLALNLTFCSIVRFPKTRRAGAALMSAAAHAAAEHPLHAGQADVLRKRLQKRRWKARTSDGQTVYVRHMLGHYGSFLMHLSILLVLAIGGAVLTMPEIIDITVMPGDSFDLGDGTRVTVERFQIEDETGKLDYASTLRAVMKDGRTLTQEIRVNEPMRVGSFKIYQQTYGTAGKVRIHNADNGATDTLYLTEPCFLSIDGRNGVFFHALYPGYIQAEDGSVTLVTSTSGAYADPVYEIQSVVDGSSSPVLAFPDETLTIGSVSFTLLEPDAYPGLRIKHVPGVLLGGLYASFVLMIAALYLCFFAAPAAIRVDEEGFALRSPKEKAGLLIEIETLLEEDL